jgi:DNA repair protein RecO (recombination protein O)
VEPARSQAILLRRHPYAETSLLAQWLTIDYGWIRTLVKGARRPKNPFRLAWDSYVLCEIQFLVSQRTDLYLLKEVVLLDPWEGLRRSWEVWACAEYFAELVLAVIEPQTKVPEVYELLRRALEYLGKKAPSRPLLERFETRVAELSGVGKDLAGALGSSYPRILRMRNRLCEYLT